MHTYSQVFQAWHGFATDSPDWPNSLLLDGRMWQTKSRITCVSERRPLVEVIRNNGRIRTFLLNGDRGDRYFTNQQVALRDTLRSEDEDDRMIILPFTALRAAGIERVTITPLEVREDRWETFTERFPPLADAQIRWRPHTGYYGDEHRIGRVVSQPRLHLSQVLTRTRWQDRTRVQEPVNERVRIADSRTGGLVAYNRNKRGDGFVDLSIEIRRHFLGDSVFRAKAHGAYRVFVSSFDYNEPVPLYYLAEIPWNERGNVRTVDEAVAALAPSIVKAAWKQRRDVKRQGDMFAIPTKLSKTEVVSRAEGEVRRNQGVYGTDHVVDESYVTRNGTTYARGTMRHVPQGRPRDHIPLELGKDWHLVVPNAVPRRRVGTMVRG